MSYSIREEIERNSVGRLGECFEDWLKENQKSLDEPITFRELTEFFEYIETHYVKDGKDYESTTF